MKKLGIIGAILSIFILLSACGSAGNASGNDAVKAVQELYKAAYDQNMEALTKMVRHFEQARGSEMDLIEEITDQIREIGGLNNLEVISLSEDQLQQELVDGLNDYFNGNWSFVYVPLVQENYIMAWIVQEIGGEQFVVDFEDFNIRDVLAGMEEEAYLDEDEDEDFSIDEEDVSANSSFEQEEVPEDDWDEEESESQLFNETIQGNWSGKYVGPYGEAAGTLTIQADTITHEFGPTNANSSLKSGSFLLRQDYDDTYDMITLNGYQWDERPEEYHHMATFFGSQSNHFFNGAVVSENRVVGEFSFKRTDATDTNDLVSEMMRGEMKGTYWAGQGGTALTLTFQEDDTAHFEFGPTEMNGRVQPGEFIQQVEYDPYRGFLTLKGLRWIDQPSGYEMVDLIGSVQGNYYNGVVATTDSQEFLGFFRVEMVE